MVDGSNKHQRDSMSLRLRSPDLPVSSETKAGGAERQEAERVACYSQTEISGKERSRKEHAKIRTPTF